MRFTPFATILFFLFGVVGYASATLIDNEDGTVTDTVTCLQWQQTTAGPVSWEQALNYAETLSLASYDDWRLPSINELRSLVDFSLAAPALDTSKFPDTQPAEYWSSTTSIRDKNRAWLVNFNTGFSGTIYFSGAVMVSISKIDNNYVRAVRDGVCDSWPISALTGANGSLDSGTPTPQTVSHGATGQFTFNADTGYHVASIAGCGTNYTNTDNGINSRTETTGSITGACAVVAFFAINQYTVSASVDGGNGSLSTGTPSPQTVAHGSTTQFTFDAAANYHVATISGCNIDYTNSDNGVKSYTVTTPPITGDCAVTATFSIDQFAVQADGAGNGAGTLISDIGGLNYSYPAETTGSAVVDYNSNVTLTATASVGSTVVWSGCESTGGTATVATCGFSNITTDQTATATFTLDQYSVTAVAGANGSLDGTTPSPKTVDHGFTTQFTFNADPNYHVATITGCELDYSNTDNAVSSYTATTPPITGICEVSATFALNRYTVQADGAGNGGGNVSADVGGIIYSYPTETSGSAILNHGSDVTLTATASVGSTVGWSGCDSTGGTSTSATCMFTNLAADKTATATFTLDQYTVTAVAGANGSLDSGTPSPQSIDHGFTAQFTFNADPNYHVATITGCDLDYSNTDNAVTSYTATTAPITGICEVSATFAINQYEVTAVAGANGSLDPTTPSPQSVAHGSTTQFTFNADANYHVVSIEGCGITYANTDNSVTTRTEITETITGVCAVNAQFSVNTHALTIEIFGKGKGKVTSEPVGIDCPGQCTQEFDYNSSVVLTATPDKGSTFKGWTGACSGRKPTCTVTVDQARTVKAQFHSFSWTMYMPSMSRRVQP